MEVKARSIKMDPGRCEQPLIPPGGPLTCQLSSSPSRQQPAVLRTSTPTGEPSRARTPGCLWPFGPTVWGSDGAWVLHGPQTLSTARSPHCGRTQLSSLGFSTWALWTLTLTKQGLWLLDSQRRAGPAPS